MSNEFLLNSLAVLDHMKLNCREVLCGHYHWKRQSGKFLSCRFITAVSSWSAWSSICELPVPPGTSWAGLQDEATGVWAMNRSATNGGIRPRVAEQRSWVNGRAYRKVKWLVNCLQTSQSFCACLDKELEQGLPAMYVKTNRSGTASVVYWSEFLDTERRCIVSCEVRNECYMLCRRK
jgi:hypothetical protein